jgi:hypothetical protein
LFYSLALEQEILRLPPPLVARFLRYTDVARRRMREVRREID